MHATIAIDVDIPIAVAYPSQRETASILRVSESSLSRAATNGVEPLQVGDRGRRYSPQMILQLATHYRKRSLNEVAGDIVAYANEHAPDYEPEIRTEVENFFAARTTPPIDKQRFLEEARRTLPRRLYEQIKRAYDEGAEAGQIHFVSQGSDPVRDTTS